MIASHARSQPPRIIGAMLAALTFAWQAQGAVAGFALTVHYETPAGTLGSIHSGAPEGEAKGPGKLMRYDVKDGKTVGKRVIFDKTDVGDVRMSPFGDRVAFLRPSDGMILVVSTEGGAATEVGPVADPGKTKGPVSTSLYWPSSEGGQWIYYHDKREKGNVLRRVNVATRKDEFVVRFNNEGGGDMTPNATPNSGYMVIRTENYHCRVYDFAKGDGDLQHCPDYIPGCGLSCSPDSTLWAANSGDHTRVNLVDMNAQIRTGWRLSEWDGDPTQGIAERAKIGWAWQNFRWAANAMNLLSVQQGPLKPGSSHLITKLDVVLYDWSNRRQFNITRNPDGHFDRAVGFWETGAKEAHLGSFRNKAPFSLALEDSRLGVGAVWDFGDGKTAKGAKIHHTFEKPGDYVVVATQGDKTFKAQVQVLKREPPTARVVFVNRQCLVVQFNEPVRATKLDIRLGGGTPVARHVLDETGRQLVIHLAQPLTGPDTLTLRGIQDLAQKPNALADAPLPVTISAWPANRDQLSFVWEDATTLNALYDESRQGLRICNATRDRDVAGVGRYGRLYSGRMGLDGSIVTGYYSTRDMRDIVKAGRFSMECVFEPARIPQRAHLLENGAKSPWPSRILQCGGWNDDSWMFMIGQKGDTLQIGVRTKEATTNEQGKSIQGPPSRLWDVATLKELRPHHLMVTYEPGRLAAYLDGRRVFENREFKGDLSNWGFGELTFGDCHNGGRHGWLGHLEGVALYARALSAQEAQSHHRYFAKKIAARPVPPSIRVEAKVTAVTPTPDAQTLLPYTEALVVNEYEIVRVLDRAKGWRFDAKLEPGARIRVAQWGLIPARFQSKKTHVAELKPGDVQTLTLEAFEGNMDGLDKVVCNDDLDISLDPLLYEPGE